ncbi:MAG TPA: hypothetical protein GXZ86_00525 [Clostridiales bacterium]|nr:hypothetical protein [Clostridiales bacterium]
MKKSRYVSLQLLSLLIMFTLLVGIFGSCMQVAIASQESGDSATLVFEYPKDVPQDDVLLNVYKGIPMWYQKYEAKEIEDIPGALTNSKNYQNLEEIIVGNDGQYTVKDVGGYCYFVRGKEPGKYYNIIKLFIVTEDDIKAGKKVIPIKTGPSAGAGYETGFNNPVGENGETVPEGFNQGIQHLVPIEGTDEMEHLLGTDELKGYQPFTTPVFQKGRALYQATTQNEMMEFINKYKKECEYMHVYNMGKTENYGYDYPLIVFTKKSIPKEASMAEVGKILQDGKLPIVWQQAQIHPYEPAAGESALVMIQELTSEYGNTLLDKIDIVMIPRVNVEGSFLYWRYDYSGTDMNRDHMVISTQQNALMHKAYYMFMPHVVVDNHEFFFSEMGNYDKNPEKFALNDFQITGATSMNNDAEVTRITTEIIVDKMHHDLKDIGFRPYHYGITSNNPIGRAYYGLSNAVSVLIESHGADGALFSLPRRVYGQVVATKSVFEGTAENAALIVAAVNAARENVVAKGKIYDEEDVLVLKQSASGAITSPTALDLCVADIYGNIEVIDSKKINLQDTVDRSRVRPTAYVVDKSEKWVNQLINILDGHGADYFNLKAGSTVDVQQYYYIEPDGKKSCIADLHELEAHTFEEGALVIPMDQMSGNIIGMLMEPDVGDSANHNGTLFQYGLITYDEKTKTLPLYRYIMDNPRESLKDMMQP